MKTMNPTEILAHEKYAMMRFFDGDMYYFCGTFDELEIAQKTCDEMNEKMRPIFGEDQYEVVAIGYCEGDEAE